MEKYTLDDIEIISGLDAVRKRPWMYVGDTEHPLLRIIGEILDNLLQMSISEFTMREETDAFILTSS